MTEVSTGQDTKINFKDIPLVIGKDGDRPPFHQHPIYPQVSYAALFTTASCSVLIKETATLKLSSIRWLIKRFKDTTFRLSTKDHDYYSQPLPSYADIIKSIIAYARKVHQYDKHLFIILILFHSFWIGIKEIVTSTYVVGRTKQSVIYGTLVSYIIGMLSAPLISLHYSLRRDLDISFSSKLLSSMIRKITIYKHTAYSSKADNNITKKNADILASMSASEIDHSIYSLVNLVHRIASDILFPLARTIMNPTPITTITFALNVIMSLTSLKILQSNSILPSVFSKQETFREFVRVSKRRPADLLRQFVKNLKTQSFRKDIVFLNAWNPVSQNILKLLHHKYGVLERASCGLFRPFKTAVWLTLKNILKQQISVKHVDIADIISNFVISEFYTSWGSDVDGILDLLDGMYFGETVELINFLESPSSTNFVPFNPTSVQIDFVNVSLKYPESDSFALNDVSFSIKHGQLVCVVGKNGSGKSTIISLLSRYLTPTSGNIYLNGIDIRRFDHNDLMKCVNMLQQTTPRYETSIEDFMNYKRGIDDKNLIPMTDAFAKAGFDDLLESYCEGLKTNLLVSRCQQHSPESLSEQFGKKYCPDCVLESDINNHVRNHKCRQPAHFSGGQWQRLALARAYQRKNIPLVLFDEPTSAVDAIGEQAVTDYLASLRGKSTTVFVSHRLKATEQADHIIVMENGKIIESGSFCELSLKRGSFKTMYDTSLVQDPYYQEL